MSIVLHYFDIYARGEPIRAILHHAGINFEDKNYSFTEWEGIKDSFEFKQLPCLEIDGMKLVQSLSIEYYLCQKLGYYNADPYKNYLSTSLVETREDFTNKKIEMVWHRKDYDGWMDWVRKTYTLVLKAIEKKYIDNGETGHFVGNSPTVADFDIFIFLHDQFIRNQVKETMLPILTEAAPKLLEFVEAFKNSSANLANYINTRPERKF
jgi:glutathione S-transferase